MTTKLPKGYQPTGRYSWSKEKAMKRAAKARKQGYKVRVIKAKTKVKRKTGYVLAAKTTPKGYGWARN